MLDVHTTRNLVFFNELKLKSLPETIEVGFSKSQSGNTPKISEASRSESPMKNDPNTSATSCPPILPLSIASLVDELLERAGSRRFYPRGETGEPHALVGTNMVAAASWGPGMWEAMKTANADDAPVTWDAHWEGAEPNHHTKVTDWELKKLAKKFGEPSSPSIFATLGAKM